MTPRKKIGIGMADVETAVAARFGLTCEQMRGLDRQRAVARLIAADAGVAGAVAGCRELLARAAEAPR